MSEQKETKTYEERFNNLTDKELVKLTQEDIEKYIKLISLERGIVPVANPEKPAYLEEPSPTCVRYYCDLLSQNVLFLFREDLERVVRTLRGMNIDGYTYTSIDNSDSVKHLRPHPHASYKNKVDEEDLLIKEDVFYTRDEVPKLKRIKERNHTMKTDYSANYSKYLEYKKLEGEVRELVENKWREGILREEKREALKKLFVEDYLSVTDDFDVALAFFIRGHHFIDTDEAFIKELMEYVDEVELAEKEK